MTSIKPPAGSSPTGSNVSLGETSGKEALQGPAFGARVSGEPPVDASAKTTQTSGAQSATSSAQTVADLRAGRITPNEAVSQLTDAAMKKNRVPPAMRAAVEQQVQAFLQSDPVVGELLRRMGATLPAAET
ncbi:MAG: hypothetical protein Q8Q09_18775 [Deltaproteobacteria bacterium]|nr:hypothetical protein [Deltaproteobacteria bacterium]